MATQHDTLWDKFLKPVFSVLLDQSEIDRLRQSIHWTAETQRLTNPQITYPDYYQQNFHGIQGGYLTVGAAVTYDPITQYVLAPHEQWVRQSLTDSIQSQPNRILDLGCGTGTTALMLKAKFPQAAVIGLDLSPYMLVMADYKSQQSSQKIQWRHGKAEATGLPSHSFDLITITLLFHETPPAISQAILKEAFRLLKPGGECIILDGSQRAIQQAEWLSQVFEEPYIKDYAAGNVEGWLKAAGFGGIHSQDVWMIHQLWRGVKPIPATDWRVDNRELDQWGEPVLGI